MTLRTLEYRFKEQAEQFLFAPANRTHTGLFRIALVVMVVISFWSNDLRLIEAGHNIPWLPYLYKHIFLTTPYWFFILCLLITFGAGLWSRAAGLLLVTLLLPLDFLTDGRQSRQILLFTLLAFSFLQSNTRQSLSGKSRENYPASAGPMWPIRLIQLQLSAAYAVNAMAKTTPEYLSGDVLIGMSLMLPNFLVDLSDGYLHAGPLAIPVAVAAIASAATEYYLALGFWFRRLRVITAAVGVLFHLILMMIVKIHMLDWACMFLYLAFLLPFDRPATQGLTEQKVRKAIVDNTTTSHRV